MLEKTAVVEALQPWFEKLRKEGWKYDIQGPKLGKKFEVVFSDALPGTLATRVKKALDHLRLPEG